MVLVLRSYEKSHFHVECYGDEFRDGMPETTCCSRAFSGDQDPRFELCTGGAVKLPTNKTVALPRVTSFFTSPSHRTIRETVAVLRDGEWLPGPIESSSEESMFESQSAWEVKLVGSGMHRQLQYRYKGNENFFPPHRSIYQYLPAGLFINVEEHEDLQIRHTAPTIDQEEPVFAAAPHGLLIEGVPNAWSLQLHARYPTPSQSSPIVFLVSPHQLIVWDVAAPPATDTLFVLGSTVMLAIIGAIVTFRDIGRVVKWV